MSFPFLTGLLLQLVAVVTVLARYRTRTLGNAGALFVIVLAFYHGVTELLQLAYPERNTFRLMTNPRSVDATVLLAGASILAFALTYVTARGRDDKQPDGSGLAALWAARVPILAIASVTTAIRLSGRIGDLAGSETEYGYWRAGLVLEYGDFALVLAALAVLYRWKSEQSIMIVLGIVAVLTVLAGTSRLTMIIVALTILSVGYRYGRRLRLTRLVALGAFGLALMIALSAARQVVGRRALREGGGMERAEGLATGLRELRGGAGGVSAGVVNDFVYRFDGNAFAAMVRDEYRGGQQPMGWYPIGANIVLLVPSFLYPAKLNVDPMLLNEKFLAVLHFGFPLGDYTVTGFGHLYAMFGGMGLLLSALAGGLAFGRTDRWLDRRTSLLGIFIAVAALRCVTNYEWGLAIYTGTMRSLLTLYVVLAAWMWFARSFQPKPVGAALASQAGKPFVASDA
jgi:hypothetical protein